MDWQPDIMFILSFTDGDSVDGAMKQGSLSIPDSIFMDRITQSDKTAIQSNDSVDRTSICNNALYANTIFIYLS